MVSLSMMARLLEAVRPDARLVLVGDPEQLASVEAGAVLGDIVGPATTGLHLRDAARDRVVAATGHDVPPTDGAAVCGHRRRRGGAALRAPSPRRHRRPGAGHPSAVTPTGRSVVLAGGGSNVHWIRTAAGAADAPDAGDVIRALAVENGRAVIEAARAGVRRRRWPRSAASASSARTGAAKRA